MTLSATGMRTSPPKEGKQLRLMLLVLFLLLWCLFFGPTYLTQDVDSKAPDTTELIRNSNSIPINEKMSRKDLHLAPWQLKKVLPVPKPVEVPEELPEQLEESVAFAPTVEPLTVDENDVHNPFPEEEVCEPTTLPVTEPVDSLPQLPEAPTQAEFAERLPTVGSNLVGIWEMGTREKIRFRFEEKRPGYVTFGLDNSSFHTLRSVAGGINVRSEKPKLVKLRYKFTNGQSINLSDNKLTVVDANTLELTGRFVVARGWHHYRLSDTSRTVTLKRVQ